MIRVLKIPDPPAYLDKNHIFLTSPNFSAQFFRAILLGLARPDLSGWNSGQPDSPLARGPAMFIGPKARGLENFWPDPTLIYWRFLNYV